MHSLNASQCVKGEALTDGEQGFGVFSALVLTMFTWVNYTETFINHYGQYARFASYECQSTAASS